MAHPVCGISCSTQGPEGPQRFSRWPSALAEPRNSECSRTFSPFAVPTRPASSRLISTRWLYAWLYTRNLSAREPTARRAPARLARLGGTETDDEMAVYARAAALVFAAR